MSAITGSILQKLLPPLLLLLALSGFCFFFFCCGAFENEIETVEVEEEKKNPSAAAAAKEAAEESRNQLYKKKAMKMLLLKLKSDKTGPIEEEQKIIESQQYNGCYYRWNMLQANFWCRNLNVYVALESLLNIFTHVLVH